MFEISWRLSPFVLCMWEFSCVAVFDDDVRMSRKDVTRFVPALVIISAHLAAGSKGWISGDIVIPQCTWAIFGLTTLEKGSKPREAIRCAPVEGLWCPGGRWHGPVSFHIGRGMGQSGFDATYGASLRYKSSTLEKYKVSKICYCHTWWLRIKGSLVWAWTSW